MRLANAAIIALCALSLSACNSIYRKGPISGKNGSVITVDAKQRHLLINPNIYNAPVKLKNGVYYVEGGGSPRIGGTSAPLGVRWRICSEASPDVFSAISSSFSADADISGTQKFQLGLAIAESASTIERTQTVNLLRESMFRTCERWLSGAIDKETFIIQAARDQRSMVAVLAVEQLTGAVKAQSTIIGGPGTSSSIADGEQVVALINQFTTERNSARTALAAAEANFATVNTSNKVCEQNPVPTDNASDCTAARARVVSAQEDVNKAQTQLDTVLGSVDDLTTKVGGSTTGITAQSGGLTGTPRVTGADLARVAEVVRDITLQSGINEGQQFCIAYLGRTQNTETYEWLDPLTKAVRVRKTGGGFDDRIVNTCLGILRTKGKAENNYLAVRFSRELDESYSIFKTIFADKLRGLDDAKSVQLKNNFEEKIGALGRVDCLSNEQCIEKIIDENGYLGVFTTPMIEVIKGL